jgi:hypothetical protein
VHLLTPKPEPVDGKPALAPAPASGACRSTRPARN